jgi:transposase
VHAVMAKEGVLPTRTDMFGLGGQAQLDEMQLGDCYRIRIDSLRDLIDSFTDEIEVLEALIHDVLKDHAGYRAVQEIDGVGRTFAAIFVAEIGDVTRFPSPDRLCSWAGLTPKHRESDTKVRRGSITKQGSKLVRWAAIEAISRNHGGDKIKADYHRIAERRGRNIGRVAAARKTLRLVYYGLRDGEIRCLAPAEGG